MSYNAIISKVLNSKESLRIKFIPSVVGSMAKKPAIHLTLASSSAKVGLSLGDASSQEFWFDIELSQSCKACYFQCIRAEHTQLTPAIVVCPTVPDIPY
ncbi:hypothetical protein MCOR06_011324 [Pyricularia oryzae]|nr:hypothetical protein MCOR06_011324 [Pyricularia oryzae]